MFAYTLNLNSWTLEQGPEPADVGAEPKKQTTRRRQPAISFREAFAAKYPEWAFIVNEFKESLGKEPKWSDLRRSNLIGFIDYLNGKFAPNTVNQYATRMKVVLNMYAEEVKLPSNFAKILSPRKVPSTAVYLNEDELKRLERYEPQNERERMVRNLFVCSAYCGARYVDIMRMNKSNIRGNELVFISQKTHKESRLPLKPIVARYIEDMPKMELNKMTYNRVIQRICKNAGISEIVKILKSGKEVECPKYEALGSHTARRSFATNLYLRGVDLYTISRLLQHSSPTLTTKYICVTMKPLDDTAMGYFD